MSFRGVITFILLLVAVLGHAQYGQIVDQVAGEQSLTIGSAIRLLGACAGSIAPELGAADARASLSRLGIRLPGASNESPITYGELAFLLTQLYDQRGAFSSRIMPGARTSFRDLQARGLIPPTARAGYTVSGADALLLQRKFLEARKAIQ